MNVTIVSIGSRGDVQPFLALARGLQQAGYTVRLAASEGFGDLAAKHNIDYFPLSGNPRDLLVGTTVTEQTNPVLMAKQLLDLGKPFIESGFRETLVACEGADVILWSFLASSSYSVAEKLGARSAVMHLQPMLRTGDFASPGLPILSFGLPAINRFTHIMAEQALWQPIRSTVRAAQKKVLGTETIGGLLGPIRQLAKSDYPVFLGVSPHVVPKASDWGAHINVSGYWTLPPSENWQPSAELSAFLAAGPPPVYVGFGSMNSNAPEKTTQLIVDAITKSGQRGLLLSGWGGIGNTDLPDHIFKIDSAPHTWLFPRMAAVVHHGGAGTTAAGLRAGVPSIIVPHFADQPFWGKQVERLGVGPKSIPRKKLTVNKLANAISKAVNTPAMQTNAKALAAKLNTEDGVANAVAAFAKTFGAPDSV